MNGDPTTRLNAAELNELFRQMFPNGFGGVGVVLEIAHGKPEVFSGRQSEEEINEMQPVLDLIKQAMAEQGLRFD